MGKDRQQRVKGNAQPSASSKAAELLGASATPVFMGFSAFGGAGALAAGDGLPGELSVIVRKLDKRDQVTKQRACEELNELLERHSEYIVALLPFWPALYGRLSTDADRRIRLGINQAHAKICKQVGKNIAPHLKELLGPWFNSIYDPMREISGCALAAFHATFPEAKRKDALAFGLDELIQYIYDNLLIKKPDTLSDPRYTSAEDMSSRYSRVVSGCLLTLSHVLDEVDQTAFKDELEAKIKEILCSDTFWRLLKHDDVSIRKSTYKVLQTLATRTTFLLEHTNELQKLFLLSAFTDKEAATHQNFWDAILIISKKLPSAWSVDAKQAKTIANNFLRFLQNACYGSFSSSYPSIIVMMSCFPETVLKEFDPVKYFDAFFAGLSCDSIDISRSESLIIAYFESLLFWVKRSSNNAEISGSTFKYGFEKIFNLYIFAYENRSLQEKLNEFKFRTIIVDNLTKFYMKQIVTKDTLDALVFLKVNECIKASSLLSTDKHCLMMRRVALLYEYALSKLDVPYLDDLIRNCTNLLRDGVGLKGNLQLLAMLPETHLKAIVAEETLLINIVANLDSSCFDILCKVLCKNSKNFANEDYGKYWDNIMNITIENTQNCDDLLAELFKELRIDTRSKYLTENRQLEAALMKLEPAKMLNLFKHLLFIPNLVRDRFIVGLFENFVHEIHGLDFSLLALLTSEICKSRFLEKSQNYELLARIGLELATIMSLMEINDETDSEEYSHLRLCYDAFSIEAKKSDHLKVSVVKMHRRSQVEVSIFVRNAKLINRGILSNEIIRTNTLQLLNIDDERWSHALQIEDATFLFLSLFDPLVEHVDISQISDDFDEFGMKPLARLFACVSAFIKQYGVENFVSEVLGVDDEELLQSFLTKCIVTCQKVSDYLQVGSNTMWLESLDDTFAELRNVCLNLYEGIVSANPRYNIEDFLLDSEDSCILPRIMKQIIQSTQSRAANLLLGPIKAHSVEFDTSVLSQCNKNPLKIDTIVSYLTFSDKLKLIQHLLKCRDHLSICILLGTRSGMKIEKIPFESDAPIPLLEAHALLDEIFEVGLNNKTLRYMETLTHYPALLEINHWQLIIDSCRERLVDAPTRETNFIEYCWHLLLYLRILVARDLSLIGEELDETIKNLNQTASMCVFKCFVNLDYSILRGGVLTFYENLISALIAYIPVEVIRREWDYDQLLVPIGKRNQEIQKAAYKLLHDLTIELVVEMSTAMDLIEYDVDNVENQARLPDPILSIIENGLGLLSTGDQGWKTQALKYLLTSMILLDHFETANMVLKSQYVAHLTEKGMLVGMLTTLTRILGLGSSERKPLDLSKWELRYIDILELDLSAAASIPLLAAHVYWRILRNIPSGVRTWFLECNNRQLSLAVEAYTEKFFGPLLIDDEVEEVINMDRGFFGDSMTIRINRGTTSSEVIASYRVDETSLEMAIRLPSCYPLKQVEIDGLQRVGVTEERWRRWMLTCNATMTSQNGSIKDALATFRQNVEKHFEGIEDCAICYSVIGALDRRLPTKQCKTCKNKFHPACLYKWFKTSNNSSCPLCRTLF